MAMHIPKAGLSTMLKEGAKHYSGMEEAVYRNIKAARELADSVATAFGPNGMNKMVINHLEKLFVTNDAATIVNELEIEHPAAKMVVMASQMQLQEVGDGTNLCVIFAGELLRLAESLLQMGLHPSEIVSGYEKAADKALELLSELVVHEVKDIRDRDAVIAALTPAIASKQFGYEDRLAAIVAEACLNVLPKTSANFNVDNVRVVKVLGAGVMDSRVMRGMVFARHPEGEIRGAKDAKVLVISCPLDVQMTETKGTVLIKSAKQLTDFSKGEEEAMEKVIKEIADSGVTVLVAGGKVGDLALHFCNRYKIMVVRLLSKFELRRLAKVVGATALPRVGAPTAEEAGHCDIVEVDEIGDSRVVVFRQETEDSAIATVVVRGSSKNVMDDIERAIDDGVNVFKGMTKDPRFLPGAGATEVELSQRLKSFGEKTPGLEQYAIKQFAKAFECVPRNLAENAGLRAGELLSMLYAAHAEGKNCEGFDVVNSGATPATGDMHAAGVWDLLSTKYWAVRFAANAANTVLRVDQIIMAKAAGGPKAPPQAGGRDQD